MKKYIITVTYLSDGKRQEMTYSINDKPLARRHYNYYKRKVGNGIYLATEFTTIIINP